MNMTEDEIIDTALNNLQKAGIKAKYNPHLNLKETDGTVDLYVNKNKITLQVEAKNEARMYQIEKLEQLNKQVGPILFITGSIGQPMRDKLREKGINWLDAAGNVFIEQDGHYIRIEGNKIIDHKPKTNRAFTKKGLQVVFYLFEEGALQLPYRKLAEVTGTGLGNLTNVMEGLQEAGYLYKKKAGQMEFNNKRDLLDRWITGWRETLKPSLLIGRYRFFDRMKLTNEQALDFTEEAMPGGEWAAEYLTGYLEPKYRTIYTQLPVAQLMQKWVLIPDPDGDLFVYKKFWKELRWGLHHPVHGRVIMTPPLLTYADLMITDDPRCMEAAERIYHQYLEHEF
jgi:hypothetical protein